jgi:hypothetical protein
VSTDPDDRIPFERLLPAGLALLLAALYALACGDTIAPGTCGEGYTYVDRTDTVTWVHHSPTDSVPVERRFRGCVKEGA